MGNYHPPYRAEKYGLARQTRDRGPWLQTRALAGDGFAWRELFNLTARHARRTAGRMLVATDLGPWRELADTFYSAR